MDENENYYGRLDSKDIVAAVQQGAKVAHLILVAPGDNLETEHFTFCTSPAYSKASWHPAQRQKLCKRCKRSLDRMTQLGFLD